MGTWGIGPFDSDDAADMISGLVKHIERVVKAKTDARARDHYGEARAAGRILLLAHNTDILGGPPLFGVLEALARMRSDVEWLAYWKQPRKIAKLLEDELETVFNRMRACKGCRRTHDTKELHAIVGAACAVKIPKPTWPKELAHARRKRRMSKATRFRIPKKKIPR